MTNSIMKKTAILLMSTAFILAIWAFWLEPAYFKISHYSIKISSFNGILKDYKIAIIADLHTGSPFNSLDKLKKIVVRTNQEEPDLVLIVGDLVIHGVLGGDFVSPAKISRELQALRAKDGVYAVLGNHDWWHDADDVRNSLEKYGIPALDEKTKRIGTGSNAFWLMGIGDLWEGNPDIAGTLKTIGDQLPIISFTHNPDTFALIPSRIALTFAGHTHGGQVYIPLLGRPVVPSRYGQKYAIGHHQEGNRHLFVSPGVGTSILPVRFLVPPEVSIVTIN